METLLKQKLKRNNMCNFKFHLVIVVILVAQVLSVDAAYASLFSNNENTPTKVSLSQELNERLIKSEIWRNQQLYRQPRSDAGYWYYWDPRVAYRGYGGARYQEPYPVGVPVYDYRYHPPQKPAQVVNEEQKKLDSSSTYPIYLDW